MFCKGQQQIGAAKILLYLSNIQRSNLGSIKVKFSPSVSQVSPCFSRLAGELLQHLSHLKENQQY